MITYPDSLGEDLHGLLRVLEEQFPHTFAGVHILPPFPSSGDRGFAPLTYLDIEPKFGTWKDIRKIGETTDVLLDLMVNHISAHSPYFTDYLAQGTQSPFSDMFLPVEKIWQDGELPQDDLQRIFLRRPQPYSTYPVGEGHEPRRLWTTFGKEDPSEQVDLDIHSSRTRNLLKEFLDQFSRSGVRMVRLDAVGYVIKKPGTACFMVEPEIYEFMKWIQAEAESRGIVLLPEVHAEYSLQKRLSEQGFWIYDFILPYRVLEALITHSGDSLKQYLRGRPQKQFTMLDCHDGVPVKPDLNGLYESTMVREVVDTCMERGGNLSLIYSPKHRDPDGFDVHQIRGTYYSLLGCNDDAYLAARAIQFFSPGIPQVYYVGLLAGENDLAALEKSKDGRVINRHNYSMREIEKEKQRRVVGRLENLIHFRNDYAAFNGHFGVIDTDSQHIHLCWTKDDLSCELKINLANYETQINYLDENGRQVQYFI